MLIKRCVKEYLMSVIFVSRPGGYIRFKDGFQESFPVEDYLDLFDLAAHNIQEEISGNSSGNHRTLQLITGEHM